MMMKLGLTVVVTCLLAGMGIAQAGGDPSAKCQANKLKAMDKYVGCRGKAEAKAVKKADEIDDEALTKCMDKFLTSWTKAEMKAEGACVNPPGLDGATVAEAAIVAYADGAAAYVRGLDIDICAAGGGGGGGLPQSGQTLCYNSGGSVVACADTGQDGEVQAGQARTFTNNGDGTITDNATGLMWEAKCDGASCGTLHDKDTTYTSDQAFTSHVTMLNDEAGFAGFTDWRVPNIQEMYSLVNHGATTPPITFSEFNTCAADCDVTSCSCTAPFFYWSSTTIAAFPDGAGVVTFLNGLVSSSGKTGTRQVRAVRGGL